MINCCTCHTMELRKTEIILSHLVLFGYFVFCHCMHLTLGSPQTINDSGISYISLKGLNPKLCFWLFVICLHIMIQCSWVSYDSKKPRILG